MVENYKKSPRPVDVHIVDGNPFMAATLRLTTAQYLEPQLEDELPGEVHIFPSEEATGNPDEKIDLDNLNQDHDHIFVVGSGSSPAARELYQKVKQLSEKNENKVVYAWSAEDVENLDDSSDRKSAIVLNNETESSNDHGFEQLANAILDKIRATFDGNTI